ncbi:MAG: MOSC domain-containing protein [Alphaproteobacteria bacterium]
MTLTVTHLYRHPVKGLTPEPLDRVALAPGAGMPHDRRFALAHGSAPFDPARPEWLPKTHFLMLMRNARLAELRTAFDARTGRLAIGRDGAETVAADITTDAGRREIEDFFADFMGDEARGRPRLVDAPGHSFSDHRNQVVSIIGHASLRALEDVLGQPVDPRRFRANLYFEGGTPWREFDWTGRDIFVGGVRLRVTERIDRCPATNVDPETARRDMKIPQALRQAFGHIFMGVYARVESEGEIAVGDRITPPNPT